VQVPYRRGAGFERADPILQSVQGTTAPNCHSSLVAAEAVCPQNPSRSLGVPPEKPTRGDSGGSSFGAMMEAADTGECDGLSPLRAVPHAGLGARPSRSGCAPRPGESLMLGIRVCPSRKSRPSMGSRLTFSGRWSMRPSGSTRAREWPMPSSAIGWAWRVRSSPPTPRRGAPGHGRAAGDPEVQVAAVATSWSGPSPEERLDAGTRVHMRADATAEQEDPDQLPVQEDGLRWRCAPEPLAEGEVEARIARTRGQRRAFEPVEALAAKGLADQQDEVDDGARLVIGIVAPQIADLRGGAWPPCTVLREKAEAPWPVGSADSEDWARPGKQWKQPAAARRSSATSSCPSPGPRLRE
jgi:hypothetical protein